MELFHEVYGFSYKAIRKILEEGTKREITKSDMIEILKQNGYEKYGYFIIPKLIDRLWDLMNKNGNYYKSKINDVTQIPLTNIQKAWLKAVLKEEQSLLFLSKEEIEKLDIQLGKTVPLYEQQYFKCFDKYQDGDNYLDEKYQLNFRMILTAIKNNAVITVEFHNKNGKKTKGVYFPLWFEYSSKDNKLRVYAKGSIRKSHHNVFTINMARIIEVSQMVEVPKWNCVNNTERCYYKQKEDSVEIEIVNERNALERAMLHFSSYKKKTEYDTVKNTHRCIIFYHKNEETELLIRILSFGPTIQVLGPKHFLAQVKIRVNRQSELLC